MKIDNCRTKKFDKVAEMPGAEANYSIIRTNIENGFEGQNENNNLFLTEIKTHIH
jgi:hypothetical protein